MNCDLVEVIEEVNVLEITETVNVLEVLLPNETVLEIIETKNTLEIVEETREILEIVTKGIQGDKGDSGVTDHTLLTNIGRHTHDEIDDHLAANNSTGLVTGGVLSINADTTKFNISAGFGFVVDNVTDPFNPTGVKVTWDAFTAIVPNFIATAASTQIGMDANGNVIQQVAAFTAQELRDTYIKLGGISHLDNINVDGAFAVTNPMYSPASTISELSSALGFVNTSGNVYSANGANLNINKSAGSTFAFGQNLHTDPRAPHDLINESGSAIFFLQVHEDGAGGTTFLPTGTTSIDSENYSVGGVLTALLPNKWSIQRIYMYPNTSLTVVAYGEDSYNTLASALDGVGKDPASELPTVSDSASFRGWLLVQQGETSLQSASTVFLSAGKFGDISVSGLTSATTTLQQAYGNSTTPEIETDTIRGALSLKDGTGIVTNKNLEILNNADEVTASIQADGDILGKDFISTSDGIITRVDGKITQIEKIGGRIIIFGRNIDGDIETVNDGKRLTTFTRVGGEIVSWTIVNI